jgi:tellurite methyltransferase
MNTNTSVGFFDRQYQEQVEHQDFQLNPFELAALPHLRGRVLDFGCGLGKLAMAVATAADLASAPEARRIKEKAGPDQQELSRKRP